MPTATWSTIYAIPRVLINRLPEAACLQRPTRAISACGWPNVAVSLRASLECLERAEKVHDPDAKRVFKQAAEFWLELANQRMA
jgi:hypothetical protein